MEDYVSGQHPEGDGASSGTGNKREQAGDAFFESWQKFMGRGKEVPAELPKTTSDELETPTSEPKKERVAGATQEQAEQHEQVTPEDEGVLIVDHDDRAEVPAAPTPRPRVTPPPMEPLIDARPSLPSIPTTPEPAPAASAESYARPESPALTQARSERTATPPEQPPSFEQLMGRPYEAATPAEKFDESVMAAENDIPIEGAIEKSHERKGNLGATSQTPQEAPVSPQIREESPFAAPSQWQGPPVSRTRAVSETPAGSSAFPSPDIYSRSQASRLSQGLYRKALLAGFFTGLAVVIIMLVIAGVR